jgi:ribose transport system ATP-binding protein
MEKELVFQTKNINKFYPGTKALQDVSLDVYKGEILGLVGENGAGKSTLFKIINGVEQATSGEMIMRGMPFEPKNPKEANELGIGMVFQEQSIITNLTVGQNIFFGKEKQFSKLGFLNWRKMYKSAAKILANIDVNDIPPEKKAGDLDFAKRQMVEIAKVLNTAQSAVHENCIILLDEPTSVLGDDGVRQLYHEMRKLKEEGNAVIFVSHRLNEILEVTDRIYVFKDGRNVGEMVTKDADENKIYEMMVGKAGSGEYYKTHKQTIPKSNTILSVSGLGKKGSFRDVSFDLHEGEILAIAGVVGSGKEDLCSVIMGDDKPDMGSIAINGKKTTFSSPYSALRNGIICVPKERREQGILGILPIYENICISCLDKVSSKGFISKEKEVKLSEDWVNKLNIKCSCADEEIEALSGGNAQKVVFSRALCADTKVLVLDHPTRGVDVGAKEEIYEIIREATAMGMGILLLGDTLAECIGMSNRILTMKDGLVTGEFDASIDKKPEEVDIVKLMM